VNQVPRAEGERVKQQELELGIGLIDQMSNDKFGLEKYHNEYRLRVLGLIQEKMKTGKEITAPPEPTIRKPGAPVISLMEALKQSMRKAAPTNDQHALHGPQRRHAREHLPGSDHARNR
jgi:non-homologous end joining protein Ku